MSDGHENPYRTSHLDPRVDGGRKGDVLASATSSPNTISHSTGSRNTTAAPSTLTSSVDPTARNPEYNQSISTKVPEAYSDSARASDNRNPFGPSHASHEGSHQTGSTSEEPSTMGKLLGAVGLGSLAGGDKHEEARHESTTAAPHPAVADTSSSTINRPVHHRKESIPTTAYPAGPNSPRAVNQPPLAAPGTTGITGNADSRTGAPAGSGFGLGSNTSGVSDSHYERAGGVRDAIHSGTTHSTGSTTAPVSNTTSTADNNSGLTSGTTDVIGGAGSAPATYHDIVTGGVPPPMGAHSTTSNIGTSREADITGTTGTAAALTSLPSHHDTTSAGTPGSNRYTIGNTGTPDVTDHTAHPSTLGVGVGTAAGLTTAHYPTETTRETITTEHTPAGVYNQERIGGATPTMLGDHDYQARTRHAAEEETRRRHEREAAAGVVPAVVSGGMLGHEHHAQQQPAITTTSTPIVDRTRNQPHATGGHHTAVHDKHFDLVDEDGGQSRGSYATTAIGGLNPVTAGDHVARDHARYLAEEENRRRQEREHNTTGLTDDGVHNTGMFGMEHKHKHDAAAVGATSGAGVAAANQEHHRTSGTHDRSSHAHQTQEKKPSIFRRIFKSRKNKDTGLDEDYSTDEEDDKAHRSTGVPTHHSESKGRSVLGPSYEEATGGIHKPSYNLFHKEENPGMVAVSDNTREGPTTVIPSDRSATAGDRSRGEVTDFANPRAAQGADAGYGDAPVGAGNTR